MPDSLTSAGAGIVVSVQGAVVDTSFTDGILPPIDTALIVEWDRPDPLYLEVTAMWTSRPCAPSRCTRRPA